MKKKRNWNKIIWTGVFISFVLPIIYLIFRLLHPDEDLPRAQSDYLLMLVQCILGTICLFLPSALAKKLKIEIPDGFHILFILFLYCAVFLGEVRYFYYTVPNWDTYLHAFSGVMIGALGFSVLSLLNKEEKIHMRLSPAFVAVFAFCFALALGTIWEIYEFTIDSIMGLNMQKYATEEGVDLIGRAALMDTMKDIIVDALGALVISVIGYISLKHKKGWVEKLLLKIKKEGKEDLPEGLAAVSSEHVLEAVPEEEDLKEEI